MHIASFVGIAPVNNPVISIAVIIDNPKKGPSYYGTAVSAPVFAEVAQEVLEYLGVTHDTPWSRNRTWPSNMRPGDG
jgi:cell division protein FtsI (penicillin-binding protein 3)